MGVCRYCGQKTGWFSESHDACVQRAKRGAEALKACIADAIVDKRPWSELRPRINRLIAASPILRQDSLSAIKEGWSQGAVKRSKEQPISWEEYLAIVDIYEEAGLNAEDMAETAGFGAIGFSYRIWTVLNDQIEPSTGRIQFNLQRGETPVFGIADVLLLEEVNQSSDAGGYSGASIRIANGVYYQFGGTRGHRVTSSSRQGVDSGDFLMTTHAVYFGGDQHGLNFRIPYKQILRFQPYSDAVGICRDNAKEQAFAPQYIPDCGWFLFNMLQALAAREQA